MSFVGNVLAALGHFSPARWPALAVGVAAAVAMLLTGSATVEETEFSYEVVPGTTVWFMIVVPFYVVAVIAVLLCWRWQQSHVAIEPSSERQSTARVSRALSVAAPIVSLQMVVSGLHGQGLLQSFPQGQVGWYFAAAYLACLIQTATFLVLFFLRAAPIPPRLVQSTLLANCFLLAAAYSTTSAAEIHKVMRGEAATDPMGEAHGVLSQAALAQVDPAAKRSQIERALALQLAHLRLAQREFTKRRDAIERLRHLQSRQQFKRVDALEDLEKQIEQLRTAWTQAVSRLITDLNMQRALPEERFGYRRALTWSTAIVPPADAVFDGLEEQIGPPRLRLSLAIRLRLYRVAADRRTLLTLEDQQTRLSKQLRRTDGLLVDWEARTDELRQIENLLDHCAYGLDSLVMLGYAESADTDNQRLPPPFEFPQAVPLAALPATERSDQGATTTEVGPQTDEQVKTLLGLLGQELAEWQTLATELNDQRLALERQADELDTQVADTNDSAEEALLAARPQINRNSWLMAGFYSLWAGCMLVGMVAVRRPRC